MRKISYMYQKSGGTDYVHSCRECANCVTALRGKKEVRKCSLYVDTESYRSDWDPGYTACRFFSGSALEAPEGSVGKGPVKGPIREEAEDPVLETQGKEAEPAREQETETGRGQETGRKKAKAGPSKTGAIREKAGKPTGHRKKDQYRDGAVQMSLFDLPGFA